MEKNKNPENESAADKQGKKCSPREQNDLMFAFDDQSPQTTPRDGGPQMATTPEKSTSSQMANELSPRSGTGDAAAQGSPTDSPRPKKMFMGSQDFLTQSSPPRFVSLEEIMKAADGVTNMSLAHEIAVNNDFRFQKVDPPPSSLAKQVHDIMHKAFWDVLEEKLSEDPPDYSQAIVLLDEVKQSFMELVLPHHHYIRAQIDEVLDMQLIEQQAEHGALDIQYYADFIIYIMAKLCAPVRDEEVDKLREIKEVVPLFKGIFATLDLMKLDMVNFTIQQIRPYLQSHSIEYEKSKFKELLKQQEENNVDGLLYTKAWLHRAGEIICKEAKDRMDSKPPSAAGSQASGKSVSDSNNKTSFSKSENATGHPDVREVVCPPGVSPAAILNTAYMELLDWNDNEVFPETLLMDQNRFLDLSEKVKWLGLVSSVLMVTYNTVGSATAGVRSFKEKLKNDIAIIISDIKFEEVNKVMPNVSDHIIKEVQQFLKDHGYKELPEDTVTLLKGQIQSIASPSQPVHKCLRERLLTHIQKLLSTPGIQEILVPAGFAAMAEEFSHVYGQFLRLITHNRAVFGAYYASIIADFLRKKAEQLSLEGK